MNCPLTQFYRLLCCLLLWRAADASAVSLPHTQALKQIAMAAQLVEYWITELRWAEYKSPTIVKGLRTLFWLELVDFLFKGYVSSP